MGWLSSNWIWIVLIGAMLSMHLRHGGHGSHDGQLEEMLEEKAAPTTTVRQHPPRPTPPLCATAMAVA